LLKIIRCPDTLARSRTIKSAATGVKRDCSLNNGGRSVSTFRKLEKDTLNRLSLATTGGVDLNLGNRCSNQAHTCACASADLGLARAGAGRPGSLSGQAPQGSFACSRSS
jgi:hypothetical protein